MFRCAAPFAMLYCSCCYKYFAALPPGLNEDPLFGEKGAAHLNICRKLILNYFISNLYASAPLCDELYRLKEILEIGWSVLRVFFVAIEVDIEIFRTFELHLFRISKSWIGQHLFEEIPPDG